MSRLFWIHEDTLNLPEDVEGFFIWDADYLQDMDYGFKKLVFIYETLCEMGVEIYQGSIPETAPKVMTEHEADRLYIYKTPNPLLQQKIDDVSDKIPVQIIEPTPFVRLDKDADLKRFFRYWNKAKKDAFKKDGGIEQ